jgi:phosphate:Na+ symporter
MQSILPFLLGGLVLFLYSIFQLSEVMKDLFTDRAKTIIEKRTSNLLSTLLIGTLITILLGSSSAVIILVIIFINARALTFRQAVGLIMGANVGTTFSSQIIALDIGKYAIIPMFVGLAIEILAKNDRRRKMGKALLYFGMLFFGLFLMENSVDPLKESPVFAEWVANIEQNYLQGALIGGLITLIIQSSSGTVGIAIVLGKEQIISTAVGISILMGAELGTCSDTLIATIRGRRQAIKAGLFHLVFNLFCIVAGLLLFTPFVKLVDWISVRPDIGHQIANAHVLFNVLGVVIFLPFIGLMEKGLNWCLPDEER